MISNFEKELERYISLPQEDKILWLSYLMFYISVIGRIYYVPMSDEVKNPPALRRLNELLHRIASFQISIISKIKAQIPDEIFFMELYKNMKKANIDVDFVMKGIRSSAEFDLS